MWAISQKALRTFWTNHPDAEEPLKAWFRVAKKAQWKSFGDIRSIYASVSIVGNCYVFNIRGNNYRLITSISSDWTVILICTVLTHKDYDRNKWKKECRCDEV